MKPVRVLLLTRVMALYRLPLYESLSRLAGWRLLVICGSQTREAGATLAEPGAKFPFSALVLRNIERRLGSVTLRWQVGAFRAARRFRPDVLVVSTEVGTLSSLLITAWAWASGRALVGWASGWEPQAPGSFAYGLKRLASRAFFGRLDAVLVYSTRAGREVEALGVNPERIVVCHNALDARGALSREEELRAQAAALRATRGPDDGPLFLYVGRMTAEKRVDLLISTFARSGAAAGGALWLVGDGPERAALEALAQSLPAATCFWGRVTDGVDAHFAAADFFVLPGLGGLALNQAMAFGTPCICSVADGTEDDLVLDGTTGIRFAAGDGGSLALALERAQAAWSSGDLARLEANTREHVLTKATVETMSEAFQAAIGAATRRRADMSPRVFRIRQRRMG